MVLLSTINYLSLKGRKEERKKKLLTKVFIKTPNVTHLVSSFSCVFYSNPSLSQIFPYKKNLIDPNDLDHLWSES